MVALWIRAGTALAGANAFGVRLLGPIAAFAGSWLLADAASRLFGGRRAGMWAALLANATLIFGTGSVLMTPDTPLLFFWTLALWALARLASSEAAGGSTRDWIVLGLAAGAAAASKYTAFLLGPAVLLWLLWVPALRPWLRRPGPWLALVLAGAVFAPVLLWNADHQWASFVRQGGRFGDWQPRRAAQFLGELVGGQIGLATPIVAVLFGAGFVRAARAALGKARPAGWSLLALVMAVPAAVFFQHALGDRVQANWPALLAPPAAIAAAGLGSAWRRWRVPACALGFALQALVWTQALAAPFPLPAKLDITLSRLAGWSGLAREVAAAAQASGAAYVAADNYGLAAELAWTLPPGITVVALEPRWRSFALPGATGLLDGTGGLLVQSARRADVAPPETATATPAGRLGRQRDGTLAEEFRLWRIHGATPSPAVVLPRPARGQ
jgi:4-amino-4-deoxy-L-arabinose transferase-like glycosyltransferase